MRSQVATIELPTDSGLTPAFFSLATNSGSGDGAIVLLACRRVDQRAVLGDDLVEQADFGKDAQEVGQLAPGNQDQLAAAFLESLEGTERFLGDEPRDAPAYRHSLLPMQ